MLGCGDGAYMDAPKISVFMITYNHERFIAQAIEGILMQKTTFPFELVIGEDCSSDGTRALAQRYADQYPGIIRLLPSNINLGMQANAHRTLLACRGEYIAFCEGDDYWTDPNKLDKQVHFLETNQRYSICFHDVIVGQDGGEALFSGKRGCYKPPQTTNLRRLLGGNYLSTASVVMRNVFQGGLPRWVRPLAMADWIIAIFGALHGEIFYIDSIMAVYRIHDAGVWSNSSSKSKINGVLVAACAVRDNLGLSFRQKWALNCYILRQYISLGAMQEEGVCVPAVSVVKAVWSNRKNRNINMLIAFIYMVSMNAVLRCRRVKL